MRAVDHEKRCGKLAADGQKLEWVAGILLSRILLPGDIHQRGARKMIKEQQFVRLFVRHEAELRAFAMPLLPRPADVEEAFLAGDFDKVKEVITPIREAKKQGHDEFMED